MAYYIFLALFGACIFPWMGASRDCYNARGLKATNLLPCNPSDSVSPCCSANDMCLSNGLCLDLGSDNSFTTQGCTDQAWASPCVANCKALAVNTGGDLYPYLLQCNGATSGPQYCCGTDTSCCQNATLVFNLPLFHTLSAPAGASTSAGSSASSSSTSSSTTSSAPSSTTTSTSDGGSSSATTIGVGVGVGAGVGLLVFGALVFLGLQIRKRLGAASGSTRIPHYEHSPSTGMHSVSQYQGSPIGGPHSGYPGDYEYPAMAPSSINPVELSSKP